MTPTARADRIVDGLIRTGRAVKPRVSDGFILLDGRDGIYWVAFNGRTLLKGERRNEATELQEGFLDAMERAGRDQKSASRFADAD